MGNRREVSRIFDEATRPKEYDSKGLILKRLQELGPGEGLKPGEAATLLRGCSHADQLRIARLRGEQSSIEDYGKHAGITTQEMLSDNQATPHLEKFLDGMQTDELVAGLIARRGGSDDQLPVPDLDRRDFIRAALGD